MMTAARLRLSALCIVPLLLVGAAASVSPTNAESTPREARKAENTLKVHYLEIVTPSVEETCKALSEAHGVAFSEPIAELGNARTAELSGGGRIGVRAPMHDAERPVVRPYVLVDDIEAALKAAQDAGATIAVPPMKIPGQGTCSVYVLAGIDHGLWEL